MVPEAPPNESLSSKLMFIGALAVLLVIFGTCAYIIYGYLSPSPPDPTGTPAITPSPVPLPTPAPSSTATPTPTPLPTPTLQVYPTPVPTPEPQVAYQDDTRITSGLKIAQPPGIWSHYIVYDEIVGKNDYKVHLYDITAAADRVIASGNVRSYGCIGSGGVGLMYGDDNRIMLYDIESKTTTPATPGKTTPRSYPHIFDNKLIYIGNDGYYNPTLGWNNVFSLYEYEMLDPSFNLWAADVPEPNELRGWGSKIVWWVANGDYKDVVLYDYVTRLTKMISPEGARSDHPRIYGNNLVYHSIIGGTHHIYIYNIDSGLTQKATSLGKQYNADIYESNIVYDDLRDDNWNIYLYDRSANKEKRLTNEPHDQMGPQIWGNYVLYMDNRNYDKNDGWDIYVLKI